MRNFRVQTSHRPKLSNITSLTTCAQNTPPLPTHNLELPQWAVSAKKCQLWTTSSRTLPVVWFTSRTEIWRLTANETSIWSMIDLHPATTEISLLLAAIGANEVAVQCAKMLKLALVVNQWVDPTRRRPLQVLFTQITKRKEICRRWELRSATETMRPL